MLDEYELLERECDSTAFKSYSPEEQAELRAQLTAVQSAIEQRENRLNIIAAAVGGLHGSYVGTMAAMLCSACPQCCCSVRRTLRKRACRLTRLARQYLCRSAALGR